MTAFFPITGAILGLYETAAILSRGSSRRLPTISTWSARRRATQAVAVAWAVGLAVHLARHEA